MVGSAYLQLRGENVIEDARIGYRIEADREAGGRMRLDLWTEPGFGASHQGGRGQAGLAVRVGA